MDPSLKSLRLKGRVNGGWSSDTGWGVPLISSGNLYEISQGLSNLTSQFLVHCPISITFIPFILQGNMLVSHAWPFFKAGGLI